MSKRLLLVAATVIMSVLLVCSGALSQSKEQGVRLTKDASELIKKARSAEDYKRALEMLQEALRVFQRFNSAENEGNALGHLGNIYDHLGRYEESLDYHERALEIRRKVRDAQGEGVQLNNIGLYHYRLGQYSKALDFYERSLEISKRIGDAATEHVILGNIGAVYVQRGEYAKGSEYFDKALAICKRTRDVPGEALAISYIAAVYRLSGQYPKALEYHQRSVDMFKKIGDMKAQSGQLLRIGNIHAQLGENEKALESYKETLILKKRLGVPIKETQKAIGVLHLDMGRIDLAEPIFKETEDAGALGLLNLAKGDFAQAKHYYEKHLASAEQSRNVTDLFSSYTGLGKACEGLEDYKAAEQYYEKGMKLIEEIRSGLLPAERKNFFEVKVDGFPRSEPAQGLTRVRMKLNQAAKSIDSSEVTRARAFSDNIAQKSEGGHAGIPKEVLEKENDLVSKVAALRKQLATTPKDVNLERYENINRQVQKAEADLKSFVETLWEKHKAYASLKYPRPVTLKESALKPEEYVVIFDVSGEGVGVKLIKGKKIAQTFYTEWKSGDLEREVKKFRQAFEEVKLREFDPELGQALYKKLLGALLMHVPEGTPLVIIPDGILAVLPFEALVVSGKPTWKKAKFGDYPEGLTYCADIYPLSYYQSITALTLARTMGQKTKPGEKLLVIADPVFDMKDQRAQGARETRVASKDEEHRAKLMVAMEEESGLQFPRLPETATLASNLGSLFKGQSDLYTGMDATKQRFMKSAPELDRYRWAVFATHGVFSTKIPGLREPFLALTTIPPGTDGLLTLSDVMSLRFNADLVALTACQTGLGKELSGEGVMSMGRAFQYAGARSILMSLWSVEEKASVQLVESFFKQMKEGKSKWEALKIARDEIRKAGYDHPFFWAPFILVGEVD